MYIMLNKGLFLFDEWDAKCSACSNGQNLGLVHYVIAPVAIMSLNSFQLLSSCTLCVISAFLSDVWDAKC